MNLTWPWGTVGIRERVPNTSPEVISRQCPWMPDASNNKNGHLPIISPLYHQALNLPSESKRLSPWIYWYLLFGTRFNDPNPIGSSLAHSDDEFSFMAAMLLFMRNASFYFNSVALMILIPHIICCSNSTLAFSTTWFINL